MVVLRSSGAGSPQGEGPERTRRGERPQRGPEPSQRNASMYGTRPRGRDTRAWQPAKAGERSSIDVEGAPPFERTGRAVQREKPLNGKPWTWRWDATSPPSQRGSKPPRGRENLRAERDARVGTSPSVDHAGDVAMRDETLVGRARSMDRAGETRRHSEGERGKGRMNPDLQGTRGTARWIPVYQRPKRRSHTERDQPDGSRTVGLTTLRMPNNSTRGTPGSEISSASASTLGR